MPSISPPRLLVAAALLALAGCEALPWRAAPLPGLEAGMTQAQVTATLGAPDAIHKSGTAETWNYCRIGVLVDRFVTVRFEGERMASAESEPDTEFGHCREQLAIVPAPPG